MEETLSDESFHPKCIATTGDTFCVSVGAANPTRDYLRSYGTRRPLLESNCFRSAQLSADGTTVVTYSEDLIYRSFILPPTLLSQTSIPHTLQAYASSAPTKSTTFALYPAFDLANPSTTLALLTHHDRPTTLTNILDYSYTPTTYPWQSPTTEAWIQPSSLAFTLDATRFVAGANHSLAVFDLQRNGEGPVSSWSTKTSAFARKRYGSAETSLTGLISALAIDQMNGVLAAASLDRQIALFEDEGSGDQITSFSLGHDKAEEEELGIKGNGITSLKWSRDGRYLFVAERGSDVVLVYDIRGSGKRLCWLKGRNAVTMQKLGFEVIDTPEEGIAIWAGGIDGCIRVWKDVTSREGAIEPDTMFQASNDAVSNVLLHPTVPIFATTSGHRKPPQDLLHLSDTDSDSETDSDSASDSESVESDASDSEDLEQENRIHDEKENTRHGEERVSTQAQGSVETRLEGKNTRNETETGPEEENDNSKLTQCSDDGLEESNKKPENTFTTPVLRKRGGFDNTLKVWLMTDLSSSAYSQPP